MGKAEIIANTGAGSYRIRADFHVYRLGLRLAEIDRRLVTAEGLRRASLELMKRQVEEELSQEDIREVWCADLATGLDGEQETIEIDGEPGTILIAPANPGFHEIDAGKLTPIMEQSVAQAMFNFLLMPGWQKWKPTYRIGTIESINYPANTCTVQLVSAKSHWQGLNINQADRLENVPVKYMTCDAQAFDAGNRVVVHFSGQSWSNPTVIGFESAPRPCEGAAVLIISSLSGTEAFAYDLLTESVVVAIDTLENVLATLRASGYASPIKLEPSQTDTQIVEVAATGITDVPGLWNIPDFLWSRVVDTYTTHGDVCGLIGPAGTYASAFFANNSASEIRYDHAILIDPDSGESRGRYSLKWLCRMFGWKEMFSGGLLFNHHLFDPEAHEDWLRPIYNEEESTCETEVNFFSQLYYQETCASDGFDKTPAEQKIQHAESSGIAGNSTVNVCFEDVVIRQETSYTRYLRIFAKEKDYEISDLEQRVITLINYERTNRDLPEIAWNHVLRKAAVRHSDDMALNEFYGHVGSDSSTFYERIDDAGFFIHETIVLPGGGEYGIGENTGRSSDGLKDASLIPNIVPETYDDVMSQAEYSSYGIAENMVAIWMASTLGHRELLLHEDMLDFAVAGTLSDDGFTYWTYLAAFRHNFFKGYACVPTAAIVDYVDAQFSFPEDAMKRLEFYLI